MIKTLAEALKLNISNKYHSETLEKDKVVFDNINKFYPCECECEVSQHEDGDWYLDHSRFYLINDVCKIVIRFDSYRKKYNFYFTENFSNISHYQISDIRKSFDAPQNVGVLTTKKIEKWVKYEQDVYLAIKKKSDELSNGVDTFLKTLEGENVKWFNNNNNKSGEIVKNGIKFSFSISDGYVSKKIEIYYDVDNTLEMFKKLSDNKLGLENKLERLVK